MTCIIVDDEAVARVLIEQYCVLKSVEVVNQFSTALEALKWLNENTVDLAFLDIHMDYFDGVDLIKTMKAPPKVILTTSDPNFAVEAFEFPFIIDYLLKPVAKERFDKAIEKIGFSKEMMLLDKKPDLEESLFVNIDKRLIKIAFEKINFIQSQRDYILINTENQNFKVHTPLWKIEEKLPEQMFFKIHRSYIININKIIDIELNSALIGKSVIPISRSYKPLLMERLNLL